MFAKCVRARLQPQFNWWSLRKRQCHICSICVPENVSVEIERRLLSKNYNKTIRWPAGELSLAWTVSVVATVHTIVHPIHIHVVCITSYRQTIVHTAAHTHISEMYLCERLSFYFFNAVVSETHPLIQHTYTNRDRIKEAKSHTYTPSHHHTGYNPHTPLTGKSQESVGDPHSFREGVHHTRIPHTVIVYVCHVIHTYSTLKMQG